MTKTTSDRGIKAIALREGEVLHGYLDSKGLLTVGTGHLCKPGEPYKLHQPITQAESDRLLKQDLKEAEDAVNGDVHVALSQNEFDALVSFVVNIGVNGFKKSTVVKRLNKSDHPGAASAMLMWKKPPEIIGRRKTEVHQFLTPDPKSVQPASISISSSSPIFSIGANVSSSLAQQPTSSDSDQRAGAADVEPPPLPDIPPTAAAPIPDVTVDKQHMSLWTRLVSIGTAIFGGAMFLKTNLESVYNKAVDAIDGRVIAYAVLSAGLIALGIWLYNNGRKGANDITRDKIATAADPDAPTVKVV